MQKRKRRNLTREHIKSVASILFLEKGFYGTTVQDIINSADISKGTFYHHFYNKFELYREIINEFLEIDRNILNVNEIDEFSLDEVFKVFVTRYYEYLLQFQKQTGRTTLHFFRMYLEAMTIMPEIREQVKEAHENFKQLLIQKAMSERGLERADASRLVTQLIFQYDGLMYWFGISPEIPIKELLKQI